MIRPHDWRLIGLTGGPGRYGLPAAAAQPLRELGESFPIWSADPDPRPGPDLSDEKPERGRGATPYRDIVQELPPPRARPILLRLLILAALTGAVAWGWFRRQHLGG